MTAVVPICSFQSSGIKAITRPYNLPVLIACDVSIIDILSYVASVCSSFRLQPRMLLDVILRNGRMIRTFFRHTEARIYCLLIFVVVFLLFSKTPPTCKNIYQRSKLRFGFFQTFFFQPWPDLTASFQQDYSMIIPSELPLII